MFGQSWQYTRGGEQYIFKSVCVCVWGGGRREHARIMWSGCNCSVQSIPTLGGGDTPPQQYLKFECFEIESENIFSGTCVLVNE